MKRVLFALIGVLAAGSATLAQPVQPPGLSRSQNLGDLPSPTTARTNLGLPPSAIIDTTNAANISSGTLPAARLPNPGTSTLGGIRSTTGASHQWISGISTSGIPALSQPAFGDISGIATLGQLPTIPSTQLSGLAASATTDTTNASNISSGTLPSTRLPFPGVSALGGVQAVGSTSHQWISYIDTSGVPHLAQPAASDISGLAASATTDTTNATNITTGTLPAGPLTGANASGANVTPSGSTVRTLANGLAGPFTLVGSGTSGQYDAQISVTGGGSVAGQGTLNLGLSPFQNFLFTDNSTQFSVGWQPEAAEYWNGMGGKTGAGGYLYATNGLYNADGTANGNVNGWLVAQNLGAVCAADGAGILGCFGPSGGPSGVYITLTPGNAVTTTFTGGNTASVISNGDIALVPFGAGNRITAVVPDGTAVGGLTRGAGCRDWQGPNDRTLSTQICNGDHGVIAGGQSNTITTAGSRGFAYGFGNSVDGPDCHAWGNQGACDGRRDVEVRAGAPFAQAGDSQIVRGSLMGSSVAGAAIRLTSTGIAANSSNCWNLPLGKAFGGRLTLVGQDSTTAGHQVLWTNRILVVKNNGGSMTVTNGTADAVISPASDTITVSATADSTNSCLNFTVTPTTQTGDTWWYTLELDGAEARH